MTLDVQENPAAQLHLLTQGNLEALVALQAQAFLGAQRDLWDHENLGKLESSGDTRRILM